MGFTSAQIVDIIRYCGYYVVGSTPVQAFGWRFTTQYGHLQFIINNLSTDEQNVVINTYLTNLYTLENAIPNVTQNQDTKQAAVWYWNTNELRDREQLFLSWRKKLCEFLGVEYGPAISGSRISFCV